MALDIYWVMAFDKTELKQLQELFKENNKAIAEAVSKGFEVMGEQIEGARSEILGRVDDLEKKVDVDFERTEESLDRKNRKGYNHEQSLIKLEKIHPRGKHAIPVSS